MQEGYYLASVRISTLVNSAHVLAGSMILELGDTCTAVNDQTNMSCSVEFKVKVCKGFSRLVLFS